MVAVRRIASITGGEALLKRRMRSLADLEDAA